MLCVPALPMFLYYFGAFWENAQRFVHMLRNSTIMELTATLLDWFVWAVENWVANLLSPFRLQALAHDGRICANESVLVPLPCMMRMHYLKSGILRIISDCEVSKVLAV